MKVLFCNGCTSKKLVPISSSDSCSSSLSWTAATSCKDGGARGQAPHACVAAKLEQKANLDFFLPCGGCSAWLSLSSTFLSCELKSVPGVVISIHTYVNVSFVVIFIRLLFFLIILLDDLGFRITAVEGKHVRVHISTHDLTYATAEVAKNRSSLNDQEKNHACTMRALKAGYVKAAWAPVEPGCCDRLGPLLMREVEELLCPRCPTRAAEEGGPHRLT